jgi:hypothetical protein
MKKRPRILFNNPLALIFFALIFSMFSEAISSNFKTLTDIIKEKPLISILSYLSILSLALSSHSIKKLIDNRIIHILNSSLCLSFFINYLSNGFTEDEGWNFLYILAYYLIYMVFVFLGRLIDNRNHVPQKKTKEEQEYPFLLDEPLNTKHESKISEDDLSKLKNKLLATKGISQSFVLGIIGAWGSGKTTLGKELHDNLENKHSEECSSIWFEPWKFKGENSVQDSLIEHLSSKLPAQSSVLKEYGDLLKHEAIPAFLKFFIDLVNHSNLKTKFEELKESLEKHGKQIYIFIDDLDRLDTKEILDVFKLIRSTLSLPQLSYVLIYDKSHIESVLESSASQKNDSRNFLDKIVQVEYYIPSKGQMSDYYAEEFFGEFEKDDTSNSNPTATSSENKFKVSNYEYEILEILKKNLENNLEEESKNFKHIFDAHILTIRDLKRLINNFLISINTIREDWKEEFEKAGHKTLSETKKYEVYFQFLLEIMKTKYPEVYDRFYFKDSGFLIQLKLHHDELYNTTASIGEDHIKADKYKQQSTQTKLSYLIAAIFGRNVMHGRFRPNLDKNLAEYENNKTRSLEDIEGEIAKVDGKPKFKIVYDTESRLLRNHNGCSIFNREGNIYLLIKPNPDESFPDYIATGGYENYEVNNETNLLLGLRFEKFANKNGFLCHTTHYDKYFGKDIKPQRESR